MNLPAKILQEKLCFPVNTKIDAQLPQKFILFQNKSKISCSCAGASKILSQQTIEFQTANTVPGSVLKAGFTPSKGLLLPG